MVFDNAYQVVGFLGGCMFPIASGFQTIKVFRTRSAKDISYAWRRAHCTLEVSASPATRAGPATAALFTANSATTPQGSPALLSKSSPASVILHCSSHALKNQTKTGSGEMAFTATGTHETSGKARAVSQTVCRASGRSVHYEDGTTYVWIESGEDEEFLSHQELTERLEKALKALPREKLPSDLARFETLPEAVTYLVDSACELTLPGAMGSFQWFSVRLEQAVFTLAHVLYLVYSLHFGLWVIYSTQLADMAVAFVMVGAKVYFDFFYKPKEKAEDDEPAVS